MSPFIRPAEPAAGLVAGVLGFAIGGTAGLLGIPWWLWLPVCLVAGWFASDIIRGVRALGATARHSRRESP